MRPFSPQDTTGTPPHLQASPLAFWCRGGGCGPTTDVRGPDASLPGVYSGRGYGIVFLMTRPVLCFTRLKDNASGGKPQSRNPPEEANPLHSHEPLLSPSQEPTAVGIQVDSPWVLLKADAAWRVRSSMIPLLKAGGVKFPFRQPLESPSSRAAVSQAAQRYWRDGRSGRPRRRNRVCGKAGRESQPEMKGETAENVSPRGTGPCFPWSILESGIEAGWRREEVTSCGFCCA
jgi:hypothetical protein